MKKSLVALAALAATGAFAQATLNGVMGLTYGNVSYGGSPTRTDIGRSAGAITLSGAEDLGNGLKAEFVVQQGLYGWTTAGGASTTTNTGNTSGNFGDRQMFATLSGGFGTLKIGRDLSGASTAPLGAGKVDGTRAITGMDDSSKDAVYIGNVRSTSISYITPSINGFQGYYGISPQNFGGLGNSSASTTITDGTNGIVAVNTPTSTSTTQNSATAFGVGYSNGPLKVALDVTNYEETIAALGNNGRVTSTGLSYDLGVVKFGYVFQTAEGEAKARTDSNIMSVSAPVGNVTFGAAFGKRGATTNGSFSAKETKHTQLSASYPLSKRTVLYFAQSIKEVAGATVDAADAKETGVGIAHSF